MASDKDRMMSNANYYADLVASAKEDCADVFVQLISPINEVERYWKGQAGAQMAQSLEETRQRVRDLYNRLVSVESQMRAQAKTIYDTWPESESKTKTET